MISMLNMILRLTLAGGMTCLVCLAVSALLRNRLRKAWLHGLWLIVTVSFLVPVPLSLRLPIPQLRLPAAAAAPAPNAETGVSQLGFSAMSPEAPETGKNPMPATGQEPAVPPSKPGIHIDVTLAFTVIWLAGAGVLLLRNIAGYFLTAGKLKKGRSLLNCGRIPVYENARITTPLLVGLVHPVIYLPKDYKNPELAVLHELCHWRRGDLWSKWLVQLVVCLHWFNPMAYLLKRELSRLSELACDEALIRDMDAAERQVYGQMLLDTLRASSDLGGPMIAVLGNNKKWLRERLLGIMDKRPVTKKNSGALAVLIICVLGTAIVSGGFLTGCMAGTGNQAKTVPPAVTSSANFAATDNVPSPAPTDISFSAIPSDDADTDKVYFWDGKDGMIPHDKSEKIYAAGIDRDATMIDDNEMSNLLGYKLVVPEKLGDRFTFLHKFLGVGYLRKFDYATADSLTHAAYKAAIDASAYKSLSEYDPYRHCAVTYKDEKWKQLELFIVSAENFHKINMVFDSVPIDISAPGFHWNSNEFPVYTASENGVDYGKPPVKLETRYNLSWTQNGFFYTLGYFYPDQITQEEAVEFAKAFMAAQVS